MECITYVIFKGKDSIFCINYLYVILHYLMNHISFSCIFFQSVTAKPGKKCGNANILCMKLVTAFHIIMGIHILLVNNST